MVGKAIVVRGVPVLLAALVAGIIGGIVAAQYQASEAAAAERELVSTAEPPACDVLAEDRTVASEDSGQAAVDSQTAPPCDRR